MGVKDLTAQIDATVDYLAHHAETIAKAQDATGLPLEDMLVAAVKVGLKAAQSKRTLLPVCGSGEQADE